MKQEIISQEPAQEELKPSIICRFIYHPATGEISFEAARDTDLANLIECKRVLENHVEDSLIGAVSDIANSVKQIGLKQDAVLTGLRELLRDLMIRQSTNTVQEESG